ncbi:MAG: methylenetetrahydrofolate reductase [Propionibacteriaceae bacterium]|nr:methylenetetrahydrofolate reductase [Propionibacteriaceae bacterium]
MTDSIAALTQGHRPTFSFEFFPPKDAAGMDQLVATAAQLEPLAPDFVSVTYGASGTSRERTIAATRLLAANTGLRVVGHLTCTDQTTYQLRAALDDYAGAGVNSILAVRGDAPGGPSQPWQPVPGGLANATQLVEFVKANGDFEVGVGAFPDGHPAGNFDLDARILANKQAAGASFAVTQLFFEPQRYVDLVVRAAAKGVTLPIIAGLMPITRLPQVRRFADLSGAPVPPGIVARLAALGDDAIAVRDEGAQIGLELAQQLLTAGAPGLHFFTQNRSGVTREILATLLADRNRG